MTNTGGTMQGMTQDPRGPNRISEETRRRYASVAPMLKHRASARDKCPSHQSREERGERPSRWAELEDEIRRFTRFSRTSPYPLLHRMMVVAEEEEARAWGVRSEREVWSEWIRRCDEQVRANCAALLPTIRVTRSPEDMEEAVDRLYDHGDAILSLVSFAPFAQKVAKTGLLALGLLFVGGCTDLAGITAPEAPSVTAAPAEWHLTTADEQRPALLDLAEAMRDGAR